jgi:hypothetical protein
LGVSALTRIRKACSNTREMMMASASIITIYCQIQRPTLDSGLGLQGKVNVGRTIVEV